MCISSELGQTAECRIQTQIKSNNRYMFLFPGKASGLMTYPSSDNTIFPP